MSDGVHFFARLFITLTCWHITVKTLVVALPPFFSSLVGMLSVLGEFPLSGYAQSLQPHLLAQDSFQPLLLGSWLLWPMLVSEWNS